MRAVFAACLLVLASTASGCLGGVLAGGASPYDYLRDDDYTKWVIEVDSTPGEAPTSANLNFLRGRIQQHVDKPDGIEFVTGGQLPSGFSPWSRAEIDALDGHQQHKTDGKTVVTHLLFLDGEYEKADVLGVTIGYRTVAIFTERIAAACSPLNPLSGCVFAEADILNAVLVHEFGHALGLVNRGIPMVEDHEGQEAHSDNPNSVMYHAVESFGSLSSLNTIPNQFDSDDMADMRAARD